MINTVGVVFSSTFVDVLVKFYIYYLLFKGCLYERKCSSKEYNVNGKKKWRGTTSYAFVHGLG